MNKDFLENLIGKRVFMILKSNHKYSGLVQQIEGKHIQFKDKFNEFVIISIDEIKVLKEVRDDEERKNGGC
ncbi:hypothetical protein HN865_04180 [Candidatus Woesearchaeota archaeon]|jgi:hypothetical protein|nr:hypothetical protein [Candidatus Woesearchaeota archaeon]MBT7238027.1 hypothetical protein [Candidatus Woesearchaeota archaeon]